MHGLIFFYLGKFLAAGSPGVTGAQGPDDVGNTTAAVRAARYLPADVYPDAEAVAMLDGIAKRTGVPLPDVVERFGEFLGPHLFKVAGSAIDPRWSVLDLVENTESLIHSIVRVRNPGATPPVLETLRHDRRHLQLVYTSKRRLCRLARGLVRGIANHLGEAVEIEETSCMHDGDPFCSFEIRIAGEDTRKQRREDETIVWQTGKWSTGEDVEVIIDAPEPPAPPTPMPATLGGHRVVRLLGSGGMGNVWLAHDDRLDRDVAIKVMLPGNAGDSVARERFLRESRSVAQIDHPNVIAIHDVGIERGVPYIVMPFLDGQSLADRLARETRLPPAEALRIAQEIAAGLGAAHARGLVHRDVKPDNVFLVGPGARVKLIDFGLARDTLLSQSSLTLDGTILGTPSYMAPERISDEVVDERADLFGLGVILYKMLSGRVPFEGRTPAAVLAAIAKGAATPLRAAVPDVDPDVADLVMSLIANAPADRPGDAASVASALERLRRSIVG